MAAGTTRLSFTCKLYAVPSEYFNSIPSHESVQFGKELSILTLGPNTVVINRNSSVKLALNSRQSLFWAQLTFCSSLEDLIKITRLVQVVINVDVSDDSAFVSEDLLFNLSENCSSQECSTPLNPRSKTITLMNENVGERVGPTFFKASKVSIALFRSQLFLENSVVDNILHKYFSFTRYLYCGDVFSVKIDNEFLTNVSDVKTERVYFKVCDIQGEKDQHGGSFVDSSVTLVQVNSCQGYLPSRRVPTKANPDLSLLLKNKECLDHLSTHNQFLVPENLQQTFSTVCSWIKPFLHKFHDMKGSSIHPVFLLSGSQGSGKCLLLEAVSRHSGIHYHRVDCVTLSAVIPGQAESKIKALFSQLNTVAPCLLHLANIQALCQDGEGKEDVRVVSCFQQHVQSLQADWPVIIVATSHDVKSISLSIQHMFLDQVSVQTPDCQQRQEILSWLLWGCDVSLDAQLRETIATQTSGFGLRDLQVLVSLAVKEKYNRTKELVNKKVDFQLSDFSKIIGMLHKAYSEAIGAPKVPSVSWKDVGGLESLKVEILRSLRSNLFSTGLKRSGLLLHGPPGTGKTLLAKAVATQCGRNFLSVKGPELLNMYVGQSEHNVRDLFELAKVASPCIIFFDELDSLAPNRGRSGDSGGVMDRVVSQLLAEMDDLGSSGEVFILGATNRPDLIDPALLRPGRLDKLLYVGPCEDENSKLSVFSALTHKLKLSDDVDLQEIVRLLPATVSGAQMSALCSTAWMSSARQRIKSGEHSSNTTIVLTKEHFLSAIKAVF